MFRRRNAQGFLAGDVIGLRGEEPPEPDAEPLLSRVMEGGNLLGPYPSLEMLRHTFQEEFARLRPEMKVLRNPAPYSVRVSPRLQALTTQVGHQVKARVE